MFTELYPIVGKRLLEPRQEDLLVAVIAQWQESAKQDRRRVHA